jgi:hypothetical protein
MGVISFAGSSGTMDVPAPLWIESDEVLFRQWGQFLVAMIKHGAIEYFQRAEMVALKPGELGLMIDGGVFATEEPSTQQGRRLLVQFFRRGDLFSSGLPTNLKFHFSAHCRSSCLIIRIAALEAFRAEFACWDRLDALLTARQAQAYSQAVSETVGRDVDRLRRVLGMLAEHPTSIDTKLGKEIEAGKQLIRDLAGVQKRSATRAFQALAESGCVNFYGYKRIFYREPQSVVQALNHKHQ